GAQVQVQFHTEADVAQVRDALAGAGTTGVQIQPLRGGVSDVVAEFLIRVPTTGDVAQEAVRDEIQAALQGSYGSDFEIVRTDAISGKVGEEFQFRAVLAVAIAFTLTLIYLAFRFEWRFGVAAVIAAIHDIFITFGFLAVANIEISLATVAAILTIIGYSLNDTIVVFDRVRENLKKKRKESFETTLDRSINETLPRTVLTSGTTLVALGALAVIGGAVIRPFATVLILGVLVGTYSSIFVAAPALFEIHQWSRKRAAAAAHATG
ncbi:MAG: protein translocase subunit SecF, partial [Gemmatimonadetes bacterium]|nr:protein translocase subunit SecF [Gemmatimonadota bacterium]